MPGPLRILEMGTLGCKINEEIKYDDENIVKVKTNEELNENNISRVQSFFRKLMRNRNT